MMLKQRLQLRDSVQVLLGGGWDGCRGGGVNPILLGGHKVPALISKIGNFAMNTATATKFCDFS